MSPTRHVVCASPAMRVPKLGDPSIIGPKKSETKNNVKRTIAFHANGPIAMTPIRISGLGGRTPFTGKDLTNIYATTNMMAVQMGQIISEKSTERQLARGISLDIFSEGCPRRFLLYPVIIVRESRQ